MQVHYSLENGVATVRMDDGKRNALSPQMFRDLNAALDQAERDRAIVILTGREEVFSAGFDLKAPYPTRPRDDFAVGIVYNVFSDERDDVIDDATEYEAYLEAYYNIFVTQWLQLQPVLQVVDNPGGQNSTTEVILGIHAALRF